MTIGLSYRDAVIPLKDENPLLHRPWVTFVLIALNVFVFVVPQGMNDPQQTDSGFVIEWAAIPCEIVTGDSLTEREITETFRGQTDQACDTDPTGDEAFPDKPVRLAALFSMFMHADFMHLIGNMWFLWIFGNNIEDRAGPSKYLVFYLVSGVVATAAHIAVGWQSSIPVVGASGAVAGVMGAYLAWFPNAPIKTFAFIWIWDIKAKWWLGFWLVSQFFVGADSAVAWMAHVGGFVFGFVIAWLVRQSPQAQRRVIAPPRTVDDRWDATGGIGDGPYARPRRIVSR